MAIYVILKKHASQALLPLAAYTDEDDAWETIALLRKSSTTPESFVMYTTYDDSHILREEEVEA